MNQNFINIILFFTAFFLLIALFSYFLKILSPIFAKKYLQSDQKNNLANKKTDKTDEDLYRKKEETYSKITKENEKENDVKIIDIVKPVGFWTNMVLGKRISELVNSAKLMKQNPKKGFWTTMVEAREKTSGKENYRK